MTGKMITSAHCKRTRGRREFLSDAFCGFGSLAFAAMLQKEQARAASVNPLAPKAPPESAKAKSVIFLFMAGGPSHLETFDPKPLLNKLTGQARPKEFGEVKRQFISGEPKLLGTKRTFRQHGKSGLWVSDLLPNIAECADDLAVIRSCQADAFVHSSAQYQLFTGRIVPGFPSMGAWMIYGLGSESESLPGYVVMPDPGGTIEAGQPVYANGFLPSVYQPSVFRAGKKPVLNLELPAEVSLDQRKKTLGLIRELDQARMTPDDEEFSARMNTYDLAFKMQTEAPAVFDISKEPPQVQDLYGVGDPVTDDYGRRCLLARRLVENGVRVVVVVSGGASIAMGRARRHRREPSAHGGPHRQTDRRSAEGPEAERAARFHSGGMGRRVRPHAGSGKAARGAITTTPASPCGWPAAACAAERSPGLPTRSACRPSKTPTTCATSTPPSSTSSAWTRTPSRICTRDGANG